MYKRLFKEGFYPSRFEIGDPVFVEVAGQHIPGNIRAVTFINAKVRYAVKVYPENTTLHNLDSAVIIWGTGNKLEWLDADNYS